MNKLSADDRIAGQLSCHRNNVMHHLTQFQYLSGLAVARRHGVKNPPYGFNDTEAIARYERKAMGHHAEWLRALAKLQRFEASLKRKPVVANAG